MSNATLILVDDAGLSVSGISSEGPLALDPAKTLVVGTDPGCDVVVKGTIGGRKNLILQWSEDDQVWTLVHTGHRCVIRLNEDEEVTWESKPRPLQHGDVIQPIGPTDPGPRFRFELTSGG